MAASATLFPDTNILLHYKPLRDIDWVACAGAANVKLVICLQVIKELDSKKDDARLSDRARRVIKELQGFVIGAAELRPHVSLEIYNEEIRFSSFPDTMSADSADDRIVFQVPQYASARPDETVSVVTEDLGMELRCRASSVSVVRLDDSLRLPEPTSELVKRNKQMASELDSLKKQKPALAALIAGNTTDTPAQRLDVVLERPTLYVAEQIVADLKTKNPHMHPPSAGPDYRLDLNAIPVSEYTRYNRELDEYFAAFPAQIEKINGFLDDKARSIRFTLWLTNDGNTPGDDIDLVLTFPSDVVEEVRDAEKNALTISLPAPPEKPTGSVTRQMRSAQIDLTASTFHNLYVANGSDRVLSVSVDGHSISAHLKRLKHGHHHEIGTFEWRYKDWPSVRPLTARWTITAGNLPSKVEGQVLFAVRQ